MSEIKLEGVCKRFGDVSVIEDLNLTIMDREFMVLVGPSGCGKSTTLRMIAGLESVSDGNLFINDRIVNDLQPKDRDVAMVFQSYALYPHMNVRDNISFGLKVRKTPKAEIEKLVSEAAETLGLTDLLDRKPKALSGGQRQRVALGRALVRKPSVFLFDEPLSNLDAELRVQMRAQISKLQKRLQITSVYVTHDQVEAMTMGHRITVMNKGEIMQVGTPLELYEAPQNLFTARFIGTPPMNVLEGSFSQDGRSIHCKDGLRLPLPENLFSTGKKHSGRRVIAGIRPEKVSAAEEETPESPFVDFENEVDVVEPLGHEVVTHTRVGEDKIIAKLHSHHIPGLGDRIKFRIHCENIHLFNPETEQRME